MNTLKKFIFLFIFSIFTASLSFADVMEFEHGTYTGESFFGQPHGRGEFVWHDGYSYSGEWKHGDREGRGKRTAPKWYRARHPGRVLPKEAVVP